VGATDRKIDMGHLQLDDILKATGGKVLCSHSEEFTGLSIDSRTISSGEIFLALKGPHFDGHDFLDGALRTGAGAIVEIPPAGATAGKTIVQTESSLSAIQNIARHLRNKSGVPVVGITGTNGKTTTKELIASILGRKFSVLKTSGNLNNHIGLPLSIVNGTGNEEIMVLEMGSNVNGDIKLLCQIARPDFAVVTNVGPAHIEGFGSLDMVRKTDLEILEYAGAVCLNADDRFLMEGVGEFKGRIITFGIRNDADVTAGDIVLGDKGSHFTLRLPGRRESGIRLGIPGTLNVYNALAAASVACMLGTDAAQIREGLGSFQGVPMRLEVLEHSGALVISDVYNANPASMEEAVRELLRLKKERTIAVLGDMLELGRYSGEAHRKLIDLLSGADIDILIAVGPEMVSASAGFAGTCYTADDSDGAASILAGILSEGDTILVKGSRGMRMERVLPPSGERRPREESHAL
jgi:UDP-N-acetylmuramoyl-tripeptide--D-alanyl-D-alanine ligase